MRRIQRGLDLPIAGEPVQSISDAAPVSSVAIVGDDYIGMKPTMAVREGDSVALGQLLFTDQKTPGVRFTSPAAGRVAAINRGVKRAFQSIVIEPEGDAEQTFESYRDRDLNTLTRSEVTDNLVNSGLWTALRTRPFSRVPAPGSVPESVFVQAIDTNPHAPDPAPIVRDHEFDFIRGLTVLQHLTNGRLFCCKPVATVLPGGDLDFVTTEEFDGPHPAGLPGTHIHFLDPVSLSKTVWYIAWPDVIAIGRLFVTGRLPTERIISLAGPAVRQPRLVRTRLGACLTDLVSGELADSENRVISGSVLSGRMANGTRAYLGRHHLQVSVLPEGRERVLLGWQRPGLDKFSIKRVFASAFAGNGRLAFTTSMEGSRRAMVPIGMYEKVMPLDIIPTYLLRALIVRDTEQAMALGCLELDEEDLALCTFVCPGKTEYGPLLRENLTVIEKEG